MGGEEGSSPNGRERHIRPERGEAEAGASPASLSALETHPQRLQAIQVLHSILPPPPHGTGRN